MTWNPVPTFTWSGVGVSAVGGVLFAFGLNILQNMLGGLLMVVGAVFLVGAGITHLLWDILDELVEQADRNPALTPIEED